MRPTLAARPLSPDGHAIRAAGSIIIAAAAYIGALWLRWWGAVPETLWTQVGYVVPAGVVGVLVAGSLVDLFSPGQSWSMALCGSFLTALVSVVAAMATTFAFRVTALPRLTFALAFVLLWLGLGTFARVSSRVPRSRAMENSNQDLTLGLAGGEASWRDEVLWILKEVGQLTMETPGVYEVILASARVRETSDGLALHVEPGALRWPFPMLKRVADVILSVLGLVLGSPLWLLVMVATRLDSPGPVLYRQTRVGQSGRLFEVLKFRTMVADAEADTGPVLARADDPRITRVGRVLRALRMDEFPQLVNVLRGEMSLVGPRPERPEFVEQFRKTIEGYDLRHLVKPGITGLAQIRGRYDTPAEDKLRFDLAYIFLWSPLLDLKIMLQTIGIMLTPERARGVARETTSPPAPKTSNSAPSGVPNAQGSTGLEV